jgi:uncharacterized protein YndB with AHSA1/START domain
MSTQSNAIEAKGEDVVLKPLEEVFDAVVDPAVLSGYFISSGSGRLEEGATVEWAFADVGG